MGRRTVVSVRSTAREATDTHGWRPKMAEKSKQSTLSQFSFTPASLVTFSIPSKAMKIVLADFVSRLEVINKTCPTCGTDRFILLWTRRLAHSAERKTWLAVMSIWRSAFGPKTRVHKLDMTSHCKQSYPL
jgi:hypothetical protein